MNIPQEITSGDSVAWLDAPTTDNLGRALNPGDWSLQYAVRGTQSLDIAATVFEGHWRSEITASDSADLSPGVFYWQAFLTKDTERVTIGAGQMKVLPNLAEETGTFDGRSQVRKDLDAVQAAMRAMISGGAVQEYTVGSRSLRKMAMTDLLTLESKLKREVVLDEKAQKMRSGLGNPNNLLVRFK